MTPCCARPPATRLSWALLLAGLCLLVQAGAAGAWAKTLRFSGYDWEVRSAGIGGPGPNRWAPDNAWVDGRGWLHLKLSQSGGRWFAAQVQTTERLGFGLYEFTVRGPVDRLDKNVVLGLFNYPTRDVGPDATNEIDIEFARWGDAGNPNGNFTVWPAEAGADYRTKPFRFALETERSRHSFAWRSGSVAFRSLAERQQGGFRLAKAWTFRPPDPWVRIGQDPEPVFINLWGFRGMAPSDGQEVEIVIERFRSCRFDDAGL